MYSVEDLIPDHLVEQSLIFKTALIVIGMLLLLISTILRKSYPLLWIVPFLAGGLVEWFGVATSYIEISEIEREINRAQTEIQSTAEEVKQVRDEVRETQREINQTKENVFSHISDSQGIGPHDSLEDRISKLENEVDVRTFGHNSLSDRVSDLESTMNELKRNRGRF